MRAWGTQVLYERSDRYLTETPGYLVVEARLTNGAEVADIFRSLAVRCLEKQINRVLVKAGDNDSAGERALRDAFTTMLLAGLPLGFRIALVAGTPAIQARYRTAQRDLALAGVDARLFESEAEAIGWLEGPDRSSRAISA